MGRITAIRMISYMEDKMKFIHLSDLHLGKRVSEFSMIEDQKYILNQIISIIDKEQPDGILIAGDVYDKSVPSEEAVLIFDAFLSQLAQRSQQVYIISGNHDSSGRMAFGRNLMTLSGIHISPVYHGEVEPLVLQDEFGEVNIYMLPFLKPAHVRAAFPEEEIETYTDALRAAIRHMDVDVSKRNVVLTHQFVTGARTSDSEERSVGGLDNVDVSVYDCFDYVALGHIHGPQKIKRETVRYCGSPLKYSFSEANHTKSVTVVELAAKGDVSVRCVELTSRRDMREIRGSYEQLTSKKNYENSNIEDYLHITLTDEEDVRNAMDRLRLIYPNLMRLDYDNARTRNYQQIAGVDQVESRTPIELFQELYELQNNQPMSQQQTAFCMELIEKIWEVRQ